MSDTEILIAWSELFTWLREESGLNPEEIRYVIACFLDRRTDDAQLSLFGHEHG